MGMPSTVPARTRSALGAAVALTLVASACSSGSTGGSPGSTANGPVPASPDAPASSSVLDFSAPALDGGTVSGTDYEGRDLAIWFWAPW